MTQTTEVYFLTARKPRTDVAAGLVSPGASLLGSFWTPFSCSHMIFPTSVHHLASCKDTLDFTPSNSLFYNPLSNILTEVLG